MTNEYMIYMRLKEHLKFHGQNYFKNWNLLFIARAHTFLKSTTLYNIVSIFKNISIKMLPTHLKVIYTYILTIGYIVTLGFYIKHLDVVKWVKTRSKEPQALLYISLACPFPPK
jgi:hypothetical protein